jgi:PAS domain S-box-containing protein
MLVLFEGSSGPAETLRFIEEKGGAGIWSWDLRTQKMEWSQGLFALLGLEPGSAEPSYALLRSMTHPEDRRPEGELERVVSDAMPTDREFRVIQSNRRVRWLSSRGEVLLDQAGKPERAIGVIFDVTRRREASLAKQASDARYRALVEAIATVVWTSDPEGKVTDLPDWRKLTGQTVEQVAGWGWLDALHPDDKTGAMQTWNRAVSKGDIFDAEFRIRRRTGEYRWYNCRGAPVRNGDGSIREWVGLCIDIHERKVWAPASNAGSAKLTGAQIRAARGLLNWSVRDLADVAKVSASTIRRLEELTGSAPGEEASLEPIREVLERGGVEFLFPPTGKAGVRPR